MKTARTLRIVLLFASLCGMPAGTSAQSSQPQEPQAVGWIFTPAVGFGGAWDDNILLANTGDNPPGDYATPLNPSADLEYRGRRTRLSTGYEGAFLLYRTFDELNSTEQHARARLEQRLTERLTVYGEGTFAQVPTTDALLLSGVPFYRVGSQMNEVGTGVEARLTKFLALRGKYSLNHVTFADDSPLVNDLQGGHEHEFVVALDRLLAPRLTIGAEFEARRAVIAGDIDGFDSNTASLGLQYDITPSLTVSGFAGRVETGCRCGPRRGDRSGGTRSRSPNAPGTSLCPRYIRDRSSPHSDSAERFRTRNGRAMSTCRSTARAATSTAAWRYSTTIRWWPRSRACARCGCPPRSATDSRAG